MLYSAYIHEVKCFIEYSIKMIKHHKYSFKFNRHLQIYFSICVSLALLLLKKHKEPIGYFVQKFGDSHLLSLK